MLALQRHAGNQAVLQRFGAPNRRSIQRALTGLKEVKPTSTYTDEALAYWRDPANQAKGIRDYVEHLVKRANAALKQLGCPEMKPVFDTSSPFRGAFDFGHWHLIINLNMWSAKAGASKLSDLSVDEAAAGAGTIYHEARHAEQHFRIARMDAGRSKQKSAADIAAEIIRARSYPVPVADAAAGDLLTDTAANAAQLGEAREWETMIHGRHTRYRSMVNRWLLEARAARQPFETMHPMRLDVTMGKLAVFLDAWESHPDRAKLVKAHTKTVATLPKQTPGDKVVLAQLRAIQTALTNLFAAWKEIKANANAGPHAQLKRFNAFQELMRKLVEALEVAHHAQPHEKDAHEAADAVEAEFRLRAQPRPQPSRTPVRVGP
jgi:hypothetical protein